MGTQEQVADSKALVTLLSSFLPEIYSGIANGCIVCL